MFIPRLSFWMKTLSKLLPHLKPYDEENDDEELEIL